MGSRRQFWLWLLAALAASAMLSGVLVWDYNQTKGKWQTFWAGDPVKGALLFFNEKGCGNCHSVNGKGGKLAPDLGFMGSTQPRLSQMVSAMWNCGPRTWARIHAEGLPYPKLNAEEMANLFAFLYTAQYVDGPGDKERGRRLMAEKACIRCHGLRAGEAGQGPALSLCATTSVAWTEAMWNRASTMESRMRLLGISWPKLPGNDMNDLLAYMAEQCKSADWEAGLLPASPERGWRLFQTKSCIACHAVNGVGGKQGPPLGPEQALPLSLGQFTAVMWNHSPQMDAAAAARDIPRPSFDGRQIADLMAFLSSLRYLEPVGSTLIGQTVFSDRHCDHCHGLSAAGGRLGPALRRRGRSYTTIALATALWRHGPEMYSSARQENIPWPKLAESDVGNLLSFLDSPLEGERR